MEVEDTAEFHEKDVRAFRIIQEILMGQPKDEKLLEATAAISWLEARLNVDYREV